MVEVVYPICRIINQSKYVFTSCKIVNNNKLIVGTNTGLLLIYNLNLQDDSQKSYIPTEIDIGKFQDYMVVNNDYIVYLSIKDSNLLLFNLLNKTNTSSILVPGTKNTVCFAVGFTSKLYGINLTIEQLKESGFIEIESPIWYYFGGMEFPAPENTKSLRFVGECLFIFTSPSSLLSSFSIFNHHSGFKSVYVYNVRTNELRNLMNNGVGEQTSSTTSLDSPTPLSSSDSPMRYDDREEFLDVCPSALDQSEALILINKPPPHNFHNHGTNSPTQIISYCDRVQLRSYNIQKMSIKWIPPPPLNLEQPLNPPNNNIPSLSSILYSFSSSLSCTMTYFCPFIVRLFNSGETSGKGSGLSTFLSSISQTSISNTHIVISLALADKPLQYISSSQLLNLCVEEKDLWSEELNVKEKEKSKKEREKNEAATLSFYQSLGHLHLLEVTSSAVSNMNYERADNLVYLDSKHQKFLVQRQNEVHKAHHKINQLSKLNSSLDTTETESSVLNLASPCVFRSFVVTPICIFELVPLSLSTIFKSLTKYIHSFNTIDFYSNIIPSEVPTFKMTSLPSSPYTSPSEISMAHFQCLALLSSVEYSESEHEVNLLGVELVGTYSDAMEVMRCRGRENQHHWKTNLYGESFVNCPKKSDSGILFPISNQVSIVPSIIVPKNENSTDLITSATRYFENLSPFFQYLIFKRAFLFRKHNYNLSFSLFDQYKFNLAFYHFLLSSVDCFFALSLFPSLLLSSPFLLQHTFFYYCGRDVDRSNYKLQWEEYLKKSKEPNPQLEKWKKFLEKEEFQGDLSDFDSVVSSLPVNEDGSEIRDIKNPMSEIFPHSVDESIPIYHHPLPYVLPSYRQSHFLRSIPEYMVNIDLISEEYLLSLSSLFAYLRLLRNLLLVQIQETVLLQEKEREIRKREREEEKKELDITKSEFVGTVANNQTHKKKKSFETAVNALLEGRMEDSSLSRVNEETINPNAISSTDYSSASLECCTLNGNPSFAQHLNLSISNLRECFYDVTKSFDSHALVMQQHFLLHPSPSIASIEGIMNNSYYGITTTPHNNIFYMSAERRLGHGILADTDNTNPAYYHNIDSHFVSSDVSKSSKSALDTFIATALMGPVSIYSKTPTKDRDESAMISKDVNAPYVIHRLRSYYVNLLMFRSMYDELMYYISKPLSYNGIPQIADPTLEELAVSLGDKLDKSTPVSIMSPPTCSCSSNASSSHVTYYTSFTSSPISSSSSPLRSLLEQTVTSRVCHTPFTLLIFIDTSLFLIIIHFFDICRKMEKRRIKFNFPEEEEDDDELSDDKINEEPSDVKDDAKEDKMLFMSDGGEAVLLRELARVKRLVYNDVSKKSASMEENLYDDLLEWEEDRIITQLLLYTPLFGGDENEIVMQMIRKNKTKILIGFLMQRGKYEMALEVSYNKWGVFKNAFSQLLRWKCPLHSPTLFHIKNNYLDNLNVLYFTRKILQLRLGRILTEGVFTSKNKEKKRKNNINEKNKDHIALYLTACSTEDLIRSLQQLPSTQIELVKKYALLLLGREENIMKTFHFKQLMGILRLKHKHPKGFSIESCKSDDDIRVLFLSFSLDNLVDVKPTKEAVPINPVTSSMMRLFSICTASVFPTKGEKVGPHVYIPLYPSIISVGTHVSTQASQNSNRMIPVVSLQAKAKYISQVDGKMIGGGTSGVIAFNPRHLIASLPNNNRIFTTSSSSSALLNLLHEYSPDQYPIHSSSTPDVLQLSDKTCKTFKSSNILSPLTASIFSFFENPSRKETTSITELTYGYKANMFMIRFRHRLPVVYSQPNKCHFISSIDKNQVNKSGYSLSNKNQIWSYDYSDGSTDPYENLSMVNEDGESVTKPKVKRNRHLEHLDTEGVIQSIYPLPQSYINNKDFKLNLSPLHSESSLKSSTRSILTFESGSSETHTYRSTPLSVDGVLKGIDDNDYYNTRQYIPIGILSILPSNAEFSITEINGPRLSLHHALGAYAALHEMEISPTPVHLAAKSKETWKEGEAVLTVSVLTFGPLELAVKRDLELIARGREKYQPIMHIDDIRKGYNTIKIFDITRFHEKSLFLSKSVTNEENSDLFDKGMSFSSSPFGAQNGIAKNKLVDDENLFDCKSKNDNPFNHFLPVRPLPRRFLNSASKLCIDNATNDDDSIISTGNVFTLSHLLFSTTLADYMQLAVALDNIYKAKEVTKNSNLGNSSTACYVPSVLAKKVSTFYDKSSWTPHRQHALPHSLQIFTHDAITGVNPLDYKIVLHFLMGYFFGNFVGSGIPSVPFVLPIQFYSSYYTRYHLIPLLEFLIEERGDKEGRDEWINALLVCMYINLIRELKLRTVIQGVKILVEKNQLTKQPVLNLDGLPESYDTITPDDDMFSHQKVSDIPKEKMSLETIPDQVQESKLVSFKGFKQSSVPIQIGSHKHTKIKQKSASIQLKFGATGEKNEKSKYIKEIKGEEESKFEHSVIESNFHPLLTEPSEILFLRLRLLFFLKYSFFFNTQTVYPLFFGKNGEGEVPQVEEIVKPKTDLLNELKNIKTKELQINSNIPIIPREIGNEKGESGGLRKDNETKKRNKNIEDKKVSDNSVIDSNIPVIENSASSDTHALSSFINSLPFNSSANSSDNSDIMLATLLSPLLFYHPYEFVEEKIILLSKMRRHYQALELLIGVVGDLQAAENYVVAFYSGAGEIESRSSSCDSTHIKDKRLNDEKYLHNTMIILMLRFHKTSHIAQYLCKFYRFLSLSLILDSFIPLELPLSSIEPFLVFVFRSLALRRMNSDICLSLLKNETLLKEERLSAERSRNFEVIKNSHCGRCGRHFETSCYHATGGVSVLTSRIYNAFLNNPSDIIGGASKSLVPSVYHLDEDLVNEDGSIKIKEEGIIEYSNTETENSQTFSIVLADPLAITPNTTAYHASCYHEILRERLSNYHPFKRPLGVCVGGLASGFVSEKQNSGKTVPVKEFFGQLKNPQNSVNQESSVQSNVYTTYPKASSRSVFTSESVRRIEGHNPPIISVLPSLSSIFISTDNSFATLLHNTVSLTHTLNDSNNCSDSKMDDEGCDEYNLTTYLDEPIIASGLNPRYVQHMPVTYMITAPDNHGALPRGGPRNNVICANAITSSLPITEDSSLLDEQRKLYEIMRISGNKIPMKEIEYEFANRYVDLEVVPKVNIKKFDISIPSIHHSVVQPSINQHSLDQTSQIKSISSSTSIQSSKTQPSLVESSQAQLSQVQSSKTPPSPVQPSKTQPDVIKPPLTQPSLIQSSQIQPFPIQSSRAQHSSIKSSETQDFPVQSSQTQHSQIPPSLTQPSLIQLPLVHDDVSHVIDTNFNNQNMTNRMNILLDNEIKSHSKRNFELRREQEREQQRQARNRLKEEIKSNNEYEEEKKKRKELEIKLEEERQLQQELEVERRICEEKEKEISIYG